MELSQGYYFTSYYILQVHFSIFGSGQVRHTWSQYALGVFYVLYQDESIGPAAISCYAAPASIGGDQSIALRVNRWSSLSLKKASNAAA